MSVFIPGKVLLSGEHSVVYGKPALAASINLGISVECRVSSVKSKNTEIVQLAIVVAGGDPHKISVDIDSNLPMGSGLGLSAAVSAAVIKTVRLFLHKPIENDELFQLTMECEKMAHGNPSGVDPAAVIYGGLLWYVKGHPIEHFEMKKPVTLLLVQTGKPQESTKEMIELVATKDKKIIEEIGMCTEEMKEILEKGEDITKIINKNGKLLELLGVVGERAYELSEDLRAIGCGVKVTGAGGIRASSGMIMVYHSDLSILLNYLIQKKVNYIQVTIGE